MSLMYCIVINVMVFGWFKCILCVSFCCVMCFVVKRMFSLLILYGVRCIVCVFFFVDDVVSFDMFVCVGVCDLVMFLCVRKCCVMCDVKSVFFCDFL